MWCGVQCLECKFPELLGGNGDHIPDDVLELQGHDTYDHGSHHEAKLVESFYV